MQHSADERGGESAQRYHANSDIMRLMSMTQIDVDDAKGRKEPERTISGVVSFGTARPKEDPHTRDCEGCDVVGRNMKHQDQDRVKRRR